MKKINVKELRELFVEIKHDNKIAFETLYKNYNKLIYGIAYSILKNKHDAEDIVQIVFEKLYYMDKDKFVHITGRKKNVIVTKNGKNIFPEEIEYLLLKSPYIAEVVVYGEAAEDGETIVKANVFPDYEKIKEDAAAGLLETDTPEAVIRAEIKTVNKQLVSYKAVKDFLLRDTEFIKTSTQKIKRYIEDNQAAH